TPSRGAGGWHVLGSRPKHRSIGGPIRPASITGVDPPTPAPPAPPGLTPVPPAPPAAPALVPPEAAAVAPSGVSVHSPLSQRPVRQSESTAQVVGAFCAPVSTFAPHATAASEGSKRESARPRSLSWTG